MKGLKIYITILLFGFCLNGYSQLITDNDSRLKSVKQLREKESKPILQSSPISWKGTRSSSPQYSTGSPFSFRRSPAPKSASGNPFNYNKASAPKSASGSPFSYSKASAPKSASGSPFSYSKASAPKSASGTPFDFESNGKKIKTSSAIPFTSNRSTSNPGFSPKLEYENSKSPSIQYTEQVSFKNKKFLPYLQLGVFSKNDMNGQTANTVKDTKLSSDLRQSAGYDTYKVPISIGNVRIGNNSKNKSVNGRVSKPKYDKKEAEIWNN